MTSLKDVRELKNKLYQDLINTNDNINISLFDIG
jgi:hypothetical protein